MGLSTDTIVILFLGFSFTAAFIAILITIKRLERRILIHDETNLIKYQREQLENKIYTATEQLVSDPIHFADTNHLILDASNGNSLDVKTDIPNLNYFSELGIVEKDYKIFDKRILCLMPFNNKYKSLYSTIRHASTFCGYECKRTDDEKLENNVNLRRYIITQIIQAQLIVAVLDGRNPNVMYEIGISHAIGKLVLLLVKREKKSDLPENLNGNRLLIYNSEDELFNLLTKTLAGVKYAEG